MENKISYVMKKMVEYEALCVERVNHFLKVYGFAKHIGELENIDADKQYILEITALMHDIGIKPAIEKYGSSSGNYQEIEGPSIAKEILEELKFDINIIERVCFIIGHHHTYSNIDGIDYQILVESDFLVNIFENKISHEQISNIKKNIFKTKSGTYILDTLFLQSDKNI